MSQRRKSGRLLLLVAFLCCAGALGLLMIKKYQDRRQAPTSSALPRSESVSSRVVVLFFATADGSGLARESREIDSCADSGDCIRTIISELVKGPLGELEPTVPQTAVNRIIVTDSLATVDLGEGFVTGLPGGSSSEMTAIYSIVNSIVANVPGITGVKFLIDGRERGTLKGSLDLRSPLSADFSLEKPLTGNAPATLSPAPPPKR